MALERETNLYLLRILYASVFLFSLSFGAYNAFVPLYAERVGAKYFDLGLIGAASAAPYGVLAFAMGVLTDRYGRRTFYLFGTILSSLLPILYLFTFTVPEIMVVRLVSGTMNAAIWVPAEAFVSEATTARDRNAAVGRYNGIWALGFLLGPLAGGILVDYFGFTALFLVASAVGTLGCSFAFSIEEPVTPHVKKERKPSPDRASLIQIFPYLLVALVNSIAGGLIFSIYPAYASGLGFSASEVGILIAAWGFVRFIIFWKTETLLRLGENKGILTAMALQTVALGLIFWARSFVESVLAVGVLGLGMGILLPAAMAGASKHAPMGRAGFAMGAFEASIGIGIIIGPLIGGYSAEVLGSDMPYLVFAVFTALVTVPVYLLLIKNKEAPAGTVTSSIPS